jgi:hypothetical protein
LVILSVSCLECVFSLHILAKNESLHQVIRLLLSFPNPFTKLYDLFFFAAGLAADILNFIKLNFAFQLTSFLAGFALFFFLNRMQVFIRLYLARWKVLPLPIYFEETFDNELGVESQD